MLTREMSRAFRHSYPPTADEREHVEELYNDTFARDGAKTMHFLTQAGLVLKKAGAIGNPKRGDVEKLLHEMDGDANRVTAFLTSVQNLLALSAKSGHPSVDDCGRYLRSVGEDEEQGALLLKRIWGFTNPKPPKPPKKGPPKEHLAATTVGRAGLEPQASRPQADLPLTRARLAFDRASPRARRPSGRCSRWNRSSTSSRRRRCSGGSTR